MDYEDYHLLKYDAM